MPWVRLDDGFDDHPKILDLSDQAYRLHVGALCFCARTLTDGFVSEGALRRLVNGGHVAELVDAGLWEIGDGGWWIHDFLDYNQSADQVLEEREKARERQRRARENRRSRTDETSPPDPGHTARHAVTPDVTEPVTHAVSSRAPSRPVPSPIPDSSRQSHTATRPDPEPTTDDDRFLAAVTAAVDLKVTDARPDRNPAAYRATVARTVPDEHGATLRQVLTDHPEWPTNWVAQEALGRPRTDPTPRQVIDACPDCTNGLVETPPGMAPCPSCSWARNGNRTGPVT